MTNMNPLKYLHKKLQGPPGDEIMETPVTITIDTTTGLIHCTPSQAPTEILEHALALAVSATASGLIDTTPHGIDEATDALATWFIGSIRTSLHNHFTQ